VAAQGGDQVKKVQITGFPGYFIGTDGTVWSQQKRLTDGSEQPTLRQVIGAPTNYGYLLVSLIRTQPDGTRKKCTKYIHKMVAQAFVKGEAKGLHVCHRDGNRQNNHWKNLRWDTPAGNMADKKLHGTHIAGEKQHLAVLTEKKVRQIRARYQKGASLGELATKFGVSKSCVHSAARGRTWKHI
jgi:hypothetical protein